MISNSCDRGQCREARQDVTLSVSIITNLITSISVYGFQARFKVSLDGKKEGPERVCCRPSSCA